MDESKIKLTYRLSKIAGCVEKGATVADIGSDHGYVPIYLVANGIVDKAYAMDVNKGPIEKAIENIEKYDVKDKVIPVLSNGLEKLEDNEVDTIIIAGMGGHLVDSILHIGEEKLKNIETLILSPHNDVEVVRKGVHDLGYRIDFEDFIKDEHKHYNMLICKKGEEYYSSELDYIYGKRLIVEKNQVFKTFLEKKYDKYSQIVVKLDSETSYAALEKKQELEDILNELKEVIKCL